MYQLSDTLFHNCINYHDNTAEPQQLEISEEISYSLRINDKKVATLIASPHAFRSLVIGYCLAEGIVDSYDEIQSIILDEPKRIADVTLKNITTYYETADLRITRHTDQTWTITADEICHYGSLLDSITKAHHTTHGVHEGALVKDGHVIAYAEDVGRHNVLDRLFGIIAEKGIDTSDKVLIFSGRVPQSVIKKVDRMGLHMICSRAMPTALGIQIAQKAGITLINCLRPDSFKVMTHPERIKF